MKRGDRVRPSRFYREQFPKRAEYRKVGTVKRMRGDFLAVVSWDDIPDRRPAEELHTDYLEVITDADDSKRS